MTDLSKVGKKPLIDPKANDSLSERRMILGPTSNINNFNNVKYKWAVTMWNRMLGCTWFPEKTDMAKDKLQYPTLTDAEQFAYDGTLGYLVFLDSINTYNPGQLGNFITAPEVAVLYGRQAFEECIVEGTKVFLKSKGWVNIETIEVGDEILACDINQKGSFEKVERVIEKQIDENIISFKGKKFSQLVTENHRMLYKCRYDKINKEILAKDCIGPRQGVSFSKGNIATSIDFKNKETDKWDTLPLEVRLMIAIQADAYIERVETYFDESLGRHTTRTLKDTWSKNRTCTIQISRNRKIQRLEMLLNELGLDYSKSKADEIGRVCYKFKPNFVTSKVFNDIIDLNKFTKKSAQEFMIELTHWDGWGTRELETEVKYTQGYDTTNKTNAEFVMAVSTLAGYRVSCSIKKDKRGYKDLYRVYFSTDVEKSKNTSRGSVTVTEQHYKGKVYCPTIKGGFFVVMHDNKVSITGNCLHSKSYEVMLEEICDSAKKEHIYNFWRENEHLLKRTLNLAEHFDNFFKDNTLENFSKAIIAMFLLEGLYFYVGFIYFYLLQSRNLMLGSAAMIRFINRDEINHVLIAANVIKAIRAENPGIIKDEDINRLFDEAVSAEKEWWHYIIGDEILGMNKDSITAYIHYLANKRLNMIGFEARYPESKNPFKKLEELADIEGDGILKENMFEAARTSYQQMNTLGGLDDF